MCDDVPNFQQCDSYDALLNTCPYTLFNSSFDDPSLSPQLSSISSQVDLSSFDSLDEVPPPGSFPGPPLHQSILFTDGSRPSGVSAASANSAHGRELAGSSSSVTPEVPQIRVIPTCNPDHLFPPSSRDLVPMSPDYFNYVWTLAIFNGGYPFDGKTEEQNHHIRVLSEIYRGTDIALDRVPELLNKTRICPSDLIAKSINWLLTDLTVNISAVQYKLILELASPKSELVLAKILQQQQDQQWEPIEFVADDGYSKKQDACFSEAAKFLSETTSFAPSAFFWRSFLDAAAWNKANHLLHNAINMTSPIPPTTFHPIVIDGMLRLYLAGCAPIPLAHPLYQYTCYDCHCFGHWSCHNGCGSRWTPTTGLPAEDKNKGPRRSTTHPLCSACRHSPTPRLSVNPGRSGV
ncbi:hypothetical protein PISMIDRAFT_10328 [Pisolithus microcarpus 441]|uniref:Uncharacterized protein n=1 Tax=Pisolithus microcarpus 441 TaxID=765257 RepID=A0A0C9YH76_9AGAM|nr:hypothetical protein PISMIDRAFT_10328 [Pisolithus microcarpus 441]